ncbi:hypothetical protein CVT24_003723 [Panaeolus cyanescens]|uniref:Uncharacterized protein n=1 Tax=Panaeolus cyanescens TaxID=181874 RepID=A0A409YXT5_9AGAR|nr:hypothetical protein CVT24_003723 [Panaeolus cyanescens]
MFMPSEKRDEKQKKLLSTIEKHLQQENAQTAAAINEIMQTVNELHTKFLVDYAACEDRIRKKWVRIQKENEVLEKYMAERVKNEEPKYKAAWDENVTGLSKARASYKAFQGTVKELASECSDLSDIRRAALPAKDRARSR